MDSLSAFAVNSNGRRWFLWALVVIIGVGACQHTSSTIRYDFKEIYDEFGVSGSFVLYDEGSDHWTFYHKEQSNQPFTPASTFKICNSLIGLETGVIEDEHFVINWDSTVRNPIWDKDHNLQTAFENSVVWYYQELARRVGASEMKKWIEAANYGNEDISGGIDKFWLEGGLRITPMQQVDFLKRLKHEQLPFSNRSMDITKSIMIETDTLNYVLRSKTGWGGQDGQEIGWYVGYLEVNNTTYYFANCIQIPSTDMEDLDKAVLFDRSRRDITMRIFQELSLTEH